MFQFSSKFLAASLSVLTIAALSIPFNPAAFADSKTTNVLKSAGVGALGGAVLGGVTERQSIGKGALYGAGAGAGAGLGYHVLKGDDR